MNKLCPYCHRNGLKCPFCSVGWMVKQGFYRYKGKVTQVYKCKNCKKTLTIREDIK